MEGGAIPNTKIFSDPVASQYQDVFEGLGFLRSYPYKIALKADATPHAVVTPRRIPLPYHQKVKDELKRMQSLGVIEEVTQPTEWVSPMVVVPKRSGDVRICVDYVHLNRSVKRGHYQLPTAEELFAKMQGAKFFTSLDAASGFWQIPLADESSELTTFLTPYGRFRFTRLPFGLNSGSEVFHRAMHTILQGIEGVTCYIDDVLIWGGHSRAA